MKLDDVSKLNALASNYHTWLKRMKALEKAYFADSNTNVNINHEQWDPRSLNEIKDDLIQACRKRVEFYQSQLMLLGVEFK